MIKGNYLYFGYKVSEKQMIKNFFNDAVLVEDVNFTIKNFKDDIGDTNLKKLIKDGKIASVSTIICQYMNKLFFAYDDDDPVINEPDELDFENVFAIGANLGIHVMCNRCCAYDDVSDWIIGIRSCHLPAFKNDILPVNIYTPTSIDIKKLKHIKKKYNIDSELGYYSISSDCWSCT
jgi:hypothetical protein